MATIQSIADKVRLELGDQPTSFDVTLHGNGTATRYETGTYPMNGNHLVITVNGFVVNDAEVDERTGVVTFDAAPEDGATVRFTGTKFRYFGAADLQVFVEASLVEQTHNRTDQFGRQMSLENLPLVEEYPLAVLATTKALWALLTDSSFDIDIYAPDGVSIPRSQRHRQLMDMLAAQQERYREYAAALNIGLDRMEVFNLRRVSKRTGRLVPIYIEKEVEDNRKPIRVHLPANTLGGPPSPSNIKHKDLVLTRGDTFSEEIDLGMDVTGYSFIAQVKVYSDSETRVAELIVTPIPGEPTKVLVALPANMSKTLPMQSVWDIQVTAPDGTITTPMGGRVHTDRDVSR